MNKLYSLIALCTWLTLSVTGQTFTGTGGNIPDDGTVKTFPVEITGLPQNTIDSSYGVESVSINLMHTCDVDLEIRIIAPDGTSRALSLNNGGSGDNYSITTFTDFASVSVTAGIAPFNGSYRPQEPLGNVNNGQNGNGIWRLQVLDEYSYNGNTGYLQTWSITFGYNPSPAFTFTSSNLPIVTIDTHGMQIPDDPKIPASFKILYNGPGQRNYVNDNADYAGSIGIEVRGSSSQMFPKKSYGFETWNIFGLEMDTCLLGMPSESDWILNANYTDKTFCRNVLAYQTWMNMGYYATRYRFVELVLNGEYMGIYILSEKIKRDKNRLNIAKLKPDENTGDDVTGGYILKIDKMTGSGGEGWTSPYPPQVHPYGQTIFIQYDYPDFEAITDPQKTYIQDYVTSFEEALKGDSFTDTAVGYRHYADEGSFFDYFLVNEISKNVDGYRLSAFFNKERDSKGGKIRMGPVWDYDIAWHNADYCDGDLVTGWAYQFPCSSDTWQVPFWWFRLLQDPLYTSHLKCRWEYLRATVLSNEYFHNFIDSVATQLDEAQVRNFIKWPILGTYVWPNPWPYPSTYSGEIESLENWLDTRLAWIDSNLPGTCHTVGMDDPVVAQAQTGVDIYPNPATDLVKINSVQRKPGKAVFDVLDQSGTLVLSIKDENRSPGFYTDQMNIERLAPGIYILRMNIDGSVSNHKLIKI